jgi:hypothetical protein
MAAEEIKEAEQLGEAFLEIRTHSEAGEKRRLIPPSVHMMQIRSCSSCAA